MHSTCGRDAQARSKAIRKIEGAVSFKEIAKLATWQTDLEALCCKEIGKNQGIMSLIEKKNPGNTGSQFENFGRSSRRFLTIN